MYLILAFICVVLVPMSLFVGLWIGDARVAMVLPFIPLVFAFFFVFLAEEEASRDL
jgi:hypothetical protein